MQSGAEEVWLVFPENHWIIVVTPTQRLIFISGEVVTTQTVLKGFNDEIIHQSNQHQNHISNYLPSNANNIVVYLADVSLMFLTLD